MVPLWSTTPAELAAPFDGGDMRSKYLDGKERPPFDAEISRIIEEEAQDGGGHAMIVAVENLAGEVYRAIETVGMGEYMAVVSAIADVGLRDVFASSPTGAGGFDSRFTVPEELRATLEAAPLEEQAGGLLEDLHTTKEELSGLPATEREELVRSRIGQGVFRARLVELWGRCAVTGCDYLPILRASHIKPWRDSTNSERLDVFNGLLLTPNLDAAFDSGLITFESAGKVMLSPRLPAQAAYLLHLGKKLRLDRKRLQPEHESYLRYHRESVFQAG